MYSLDYIQKLVELLPPDKRDDTIVAFNTPAFLDIQNLHQGMFFTYKNFQSLDVWSAGTYDKNDLVNYQKAIYQSVEDSNATEPTYSDKWVLISPNFFGVDYRLQIRGEKLVLEYALNLWFGTEFRQPPLVSDIYIENNATVYQSPFKIGRTETQSSKSGTLGSIDFIGLDYTFTEQFGCTIFVPLAIFNSLGSDNQIRENIVRDFADKYIACGVKYKIQTY